MESNPYQAPSADPLGTNTAGGAVTPRMVSELVGTKPWVRLLAVLGFIGGGLMILGGVVMAVVLAAQMGPGAFMVGAIYALMGLIYLFPAFKLWKYGSAITTLQYSAEPEHLENALGAQRSFWKITGIMLIVGFVLGILMSIGMGIFGMTMAARDGGGAFDIPLDPSEFEQPNFELE